MVRHIEDEEDEDEEEGEEEEDDGMEEELEAAKPHRGRPAVPPRMKPQQQPQPSVPQVSQKQTSKPEVSKAKKYGSFYQPERIGVADAQTGEVVMDNIQTAQGLAEAFAIIKSDLEEIKDILGRM